MVGGDEVIANSFLEAGELVSFKRGEDIVSQGDVEDDSVYFLLSGAADVFVNGKRRDDIQRTAPITVGEMSALNPAQKRSATVRAASRQLVALKVEGETFRKVVGENREFLRRVHEDFSGRGRQAILATGISRRTSGWNWTVISLTAGVLSAAAIWYTLRVDGNPVFVRVLLPLVVGLTIFLLTLLADPVYRFFRLGTLCVGAILVDEALQWQVRGSFMGAEFQYQISSSGDPQQATALLAPIVLGALAAYLFWIDTTKR
ncbi:cyclic nucleotide-binding domain-containing protein [Rhodovulum sp. MB263]|uniref:Pycsar effector protein RsmPycTIR n=1 Tax=Rhodovulum sp. (strain MB263) TaxID=308754 RepID=PCTIR_RHOS2|nr:cyclic nucleotide-binding domain-containing protein [Rhodovulum sp. MB263]A0A1V0HUU2.1 RecName: Full=Pycsar effector protein RsmPycTIR; Short=RsmPycTIR [Rhodovulum sp. MB263]ARC87742.1 hypothetical protein B5V46_03435 [Rhodovulum sp. MB263]